MEDNNDIVIKFKKDNGNIFLESIEDNGEKTPYTSEKPLLTVNENGTYSKVENPDLNDIISSSVQEPINEQEVDNDFDYPDVYNTNEEVIGKPPTKTDVVPSNEVVAAPSNEVVEAPSNEVVEAPSNEVVEAASNECEEKFNVYNNEIASADCNTILNKKQQNINPYINYFLNIPSYKEELEYLDLLEIIVKYKYDINQQFGLDDNNLININNANINKMNKYLKL
jgi:hypothetical protein